MADASQVNFYDNFIQHFWEQKDNERNKSFRDFARRWISPHYEAKRPFILDFGCALGYNSAEFYNEGCRVVGIDLSPVCIARAKKLYPSCEWYAGDILDGFNPPYLGSPDFILMSDVIEHVPKAKHETLFDIMYEWSTPDAVILASLPSEEVHEESKALGQPVEESVAPWECLQAMDTAGWSRVVSLYLQYPYYRMVIQKGKG